jgi:hypothetical protein
MYKSIGEEDINLQVGVDFAEPCELAVGEMLSTPIRAMLLWAGRRRREGGPERPATGCSSHVRPRQQLPRRVLHPPLVPGMPKKRIEPTHMARRKKGLKGGRGNLQSSRRQAAPNISRAFAESKAA